jgi:hypothetical protein
VDEGALGTAEAELVAWGLLERSPKLAWSRRFRGAVMREAARLAEEEKAGRKPEGSPLATAVRAAMAGSGLPAAASPTRVHEQLLVAVELAALPEPMRRLLG